MTVFFDNTLEQLSGMALNLGSRILISVIVLFIGSKLIKILLRILKKALKKTEADESVESFLYSFVKVSLYVILVFMIASYCGVDAASIVALLGSAGVAIGLALQGSLSNLAGGVLLLILRPFNVGDYIIDAAGNEGTVDEIQVFFTRLRTVDNRIIVLPNGNLANNCITNVTTSKCRRCDIAINISYDADLKKTKEVLLDLLENDAKVMKSRDRMVYVDSLGESSMVLVVRCWFENCDFFEGKCRLNENIKYALEEANITIAHQQMDVHIKKDS